MFPAQAEIRGIGLNLTKMLMLVPSEHGLNFGRFRVMFEQNLQGLLISL